MSQPRRAIAWASGVALASAVAACTVPRTPDEDAAFPHRDAHFAVDASRDAPATDTNPRPLDTGAPDAWVAPTDAWVAPPDAWVAPPDAWVAPDAGCTTASGSTTILIHTVEPDPIAGGTRDLGLVQVRAESACGGTDIELSTDAAGALALDLPNSGAPWTITMAEAGYAAVSVLDASASGFFVGDVRLDPIAAPASVMHRISGTVTGIASGIVRVDSYDLDTALAPPGAPTFSAAFYVGNEQPTPALPLVGVEYDGSGRALNLGSTPAIARPSADVTGVVLAMPTPRQTPTVNHIRIALPTRGITLGAIGPPHDIGARHVLFDSPGAPFVRTGTVLLTPGAMVDLEIAHFAGPFDANLSGLSMMGATVQLDVDVTDLGDHTITIPPVDALTITGTSLANLSASGAGAGYDVLALHIGAATARRPSWRIFANASSGAARIEAIPHLPSTVTLAQIGLSDASASCQLLYVHVQTGAAWSTEALNRSVWQYGWAVGASHAPISTAGR